MPPQIVLIATMLFVGLPAPASVFQKEYYQTIDKHCVPGFSKSDCCAPFCEMHQTPRAHALACFIVLSWSVARYMIGNSAEFMNEKCFIAL